MTFSRCSLLAIAICCTTVVGGCASSHKRAWLPHEFAAPLPRASLANTSSPDEIEASYAKAMALERQGSSECVDWYLRSARLLWTQVASKDVESNSREIELYRSSVGKLIETGQRFGRFDAVNGIALSESNVLDINRSKLRDFADRALPVRYYGFAWQPSDFQAISVVGQYRTPDVIRPHQQTGVGVPLLVQTTSPDSFILRKANFAATAIVRPDNEHSTADDHSSFVLDIINPNTIRKMRINGRSSAIAYDLTAPLAYLSVNDHDYDWLKGLLRPETVEDKTGLTMVEPYRRGKIPVVFVHGLASEPMTWAAMANEFSKFTDLMEDYQFWIFSYPTGTPFPREAASLRHQLVALREHIDPDRSDPALDRLVLIGHSMGGLISKLQITRSGDRLTRTIFKAPLEELDMSPEMRQGLNDILLFEPSDQVRRVIFIGTPHRGSKLASGAVGNVTSHLVRRSDALVDQCKQFMRLHPEALAMPMHRMPTSVDMLRPDNPLLTAIFELPINPHVRMHSIVGVGHSGPGTEPGDGVVPLSSARHPGVESEMTVPAKHDLHHHPDTINEVVRILRIHASADEGQSSAQPLAVRHVNKVSGSSTIPPLQDPRK